MFCLFLGPIVEFLREKYDTYKTKRKCPNIFRDVVPSLFLKSIVVTGGAKMVHL